MLNPPRMKKKKPSLTSRRCKIRISLLKAETIEMVEMKWGIEVFRHFLN